MPWIRFVSYALCWIVASLLVKVSAVCKQSAMQSCTQRLAFHDSNKVPASAAGIEKQCRSVDDYLNCLRERDCIDMAETTRIVLHYVCKDRKTVDVSAECEQSIIQSCTTRFAFNDPNNLPASAADLEIQCSNPSTEGYLNCLREKGCYKEAESAKVFLDYFCIDHREDLIEVLPCTSSKGMKEFGQICQYRLMTMQNENICKRTNWLLSCIVKSAGSCCGEKARRLLDEFFKLIDRESRRQGVTSTCIINTNLDVDITLACSSAQGLRVGLLGMLVAVSVLLRRILGI